MERNNSYPWFKIAVQYLIASEFILKIICKNENSRSYFGDVIDDDLLMEKLESNDGEMFYPVMLNLYHALEITYKGLIQLHKKENPPGNHNLINLLVEVKSIAEISYDDKKLLGCYVDDIEDKFQEFNKWLLLNNMSIDNFYLFLKYPVSNINKGSETQVVDIFASDDLLGKERITLPFYENLLCDIKKLRRFIVSNYYNTTNEDR
jgi:hypothetical protein